MNNNIFNDLKERGYIYQATNEEQIKSMLNGEQITFYLGIDPTADSLHIGHFFALMMFRQLQDAGHRGIIVIGGATALIPDPTGKSTLRKMITKEEVNSNIAEVKKLVERFVKTDGENPAIIVNNADWINMYTYVDFMRDIGIHFNVNRMLSTEVYASRLEEGGLTFLEMGYMLMQSYDFVQLNKNYGCKLQIGGSDQWGNIVAGVSLSRKINNISDDDISGDELFGLTCPLLMTKEGKKMGKTENGALWVAREKTTVFDFYQYFYNVRDEEVETLLRLFTKVTLEEIKSLCTNDIISAKKVMAFEITKLVHGEEEANNVVKTVGELFGGNLNLENVPSFEINEEIIQNGISIIDLLTTTNFICSKSEAKRMIEQGGISLNDKKIQNTDYIVGVSNFEKGYVLLKRGKKNFLKVIIK